MKTYTIKLNAEALDIIRKALAKEKDAHQEAIKNLQWVDSILYKTEPDPENERKI